MLVTLPLLFGKIPPNPYYGFRLSPALDDPKVWYATNKHSAKRLIVAGACSTISAIVLYFVPGLTIATYALACLGVFALVAIVGLVQSVRYMKSLARDQNAG
jgi:hypothetical protein